MCLFWRDFLFVRERDTTHGVLWSQSHIFRVSRSGVLNKSVFHPVKRGTLNAYRHTHTQLGLLFLCVCSLFRVGLTGQPAEQNHKLLGVPPI